MKGWRTNLNQNLPTCPSRSIPHMRCRGSAPPQVDQVPGGPQSTSRSLHQKSTARRGCWKWGGWELFQRPKFNGLEKVRITPEWFWKWLLDVILRGKKSCPVEQGAAKGCERDNDCDELEVTRSWGAGWLWNQMWAVRGLRAESALSSYQVFKVQNLLQGYAWCCRKRQTSQNFFCLIKF